MENMEAARAEWRENGAVLLPGLLDPEAFRRLVYKDTPAAELRP